MEFIKKNIKINGVKTSCWIRGRPDKQPVVFLHGFPGTHRGMVPVVSHFSSTYRVIMPDLPGCGKSDALVGIHTLQQYAQWLNQFLVAIGIDRAIIVGHSFGGRITMAYAAEYSSKVEKIVLIAPVLKVDGFMAYVASFYYSISKFLPRYFRAIWLSNGLYQKVSHTIICKEKDPKKRRQILAARVKEAKGINAKITTEIFNETYREDLIATFGNKIECPALLVVGREDDLVSLSSMAALALVLPRAQLEIVDDTGHLAPIEKSAQVANAIKEWLKK